MAFDNTVTIIGNVTRDPELRFTPSGLPVCQFGVAWNQRNRDGEDTAHFFEVTCWQSLAENVSESINKGTRVVVYGRLDWSSWETEQGEKRNQVRLVADEVSPSLRWATTDVTRNESKGGDFGQSGDSGGQTATTTTVNPTDEEPF
jgi:single-strand DNA-binding protein